MNANKKGMAIGRAMYTTGGACGGIALFLLTEGAKTSAVPALGALSSLLFLLGLTIRWRSLSNR